MNDNVKKILDKYGREVIAEMITRLTNAGHSASGKLINSLAYDIQNNLEEISITFSMADYGYYVDKGRKPGKMPPVSKILEWTRLKGIPEKAAWPIARSIGKFGIAPTNFFTISTTRRLSSLENMVGEAYLKDLDDELKKEVDTINKEIKK